MRLKSDMNLAEIQTDTWTVLQEAAELCTYMMYIICSWKDKHVSNASECLSRNCIESKRKTLTFVQGVAEV